MQDVDSDMECELEASPAVSVDVVSEAMAHVKVSKKEIEDNYMRLLLFPLKSPCSVSREELVLYT